MDVKKKKRNQSPIALQLRKQIEFHETTSKKTSPNNNLEMVFKDQKLKDKIVGLFHKSRENKEKIKPIVQKTNNLLKLNDSDDDSQESEKEGYNEQLSKN